jgi:flavin reductase (DIM6/NTAB) family NADH-FMN oxidoreductase RutF
MDSRVEQLHAYGTHSIIVARVGAIRTHGASKTLLLEEGKLLTAQVGL